LWEEARRKVASPVHDALDSDDIFVNPKQDDVAADHAEACVFANLRAQAVDSWAVDSWAVDAWIVADPVEGLANLPDKCDCPLGIVSGDPVADVLEIGLDES
jgi:hypothetical protein